MQNKQLKKDEFLFLSKRFALTSAKNRNKQTSIFSSDLLDEKLCLEILDNLGNTLNSPNLKITASLLSKRIAFLVSASALYSMSVFDKALDLSIDNCYFDFNHDGSLWQSKLPLKSLDSHYLLSKNRDQLRKKVLKSLFADHLSLLWNTLSKVTNISQKILWENTAVRVYSLYENKIDKNIKLRYSKNIQNDFEFLVSSEEYELFGEKYNPLKYFYPKNKKNRKTCCFYYKTTQKKTFCKNCPLK